MKKIIVLMMGMLALPACMYFDTPPVCVNVTKLEMPVMFGNNMLLQRDMEAPVWGETTPGATVEVKIAGQTKTATAGKDGKWKLKLDPLKPGGPLIMTVKAGKKSLTFKNVSAGDVWICSGQSNMAWPVSRSINAQEEIKGANYPQIRLFKVANNSNCVEPSTKCRGSWQVCSPSSVKYFSAAGYFFGRMLHKELKIPIGLIGTNWGGTPAESWMPVSALKTDPDFQPIIDRCDKDKADYDKKLKVFKEKYPAWRKEYREYRKKVAQLKKEGKVQEIRKLKRPGRPRRPYGPGNPRTYSVLYNGMIHPLVPYGIKGAIWYQGEANAGRAYQYRKLLPAMVKAWRQAWGEGDFPFLIVQLANYRSTTNDPNRASAWAELREAQFMTTEIPNAAIAAAIDIGEARSIHPLNKQDVGKRLALAALGTTYDRKLVHYGPVYDTMKIDGGKIRLYFKHMGGGLVAKGGELKHFAIAGKNKKFVWANAKIDGDTVLVWSDKVKDPVAVRYAWADNPASANLYNKEDLPAFPFRTDDWPGRTINSK